MPRVKQVARRKGYGQKGKKTNTIGSTTQQELTPQIPKPTNDEAPKVKKTNTQPISPTNTTGLTRPQPKPTNTGALVNRRRSWRIASADKPTPAWDGTKVSQQKPPVFVIETDSDDASEANKETPQKKKQMPSRSKSQTSGSEEYEAFRKRKTQENKDKIESLRMSKLARSFKDSMTKGNTSKKGKEKKVNTSDTDEEYLPQSDSELNAEEQPETPKKSPNVEVPKRKPGRPKKTPSPIVEPSPSSETSPVQPNIKPAATLDELTKKVKFMGPRKLYWPTLGNLKVDNVFHAWLSPVWKRFFDISQSVYKDLVYEFFSTYRFNKNTQDVNSKSAMYFKLGGKWFNLSFSEFAVTMNLYTSEEVLDESFKAGLTGWPTDENHSEFWKTFGTGEYTKNISDTHIPSPTYRILHRAVAETINQRGSSMNLVTVDDLFFMWCIVEKKPCNLAKCLAKLLYKGMGKVDSSAVCGGAYVTQLAIGLGVVTEDQLNRMEILAYTGLFEETHLRRMGILEKDKPWRFVGTNCGTTSEATQASTPITLEEKLDWSNNALYFLIQQLGHSFDPPPHMRTDGDGAADGDSDED